MLNVPLTGLRIDHVKLDAVPPTTSMTDALNVALPVTPDSAVTADCDTETTVLFVKLSAVVTVRGVPATTTTACKSAVAVAPVTPVTAAVAVAVPAPPLIEKVPPDWAITLHVHEDATPPTVVAVHDANVPELPATVSGATDDKDTVAPPPPTAPIADVANSACMVTRCQTR
jgi:hypothetical protein